jgi:hypothetical protein
MAEKPKTLEERFQAWEEKGKEGEKITYGMLGDGFQSIRGIPDDFYSAEDPTDRVGLWDRYGMEYQKEQYRLGGRCYRC